MTVTGSAVPPSRERRGAAGRRGVKIAIGDGRPAGRAAARGPAAHAASDRAAAAHRRGVAGTSSSTASASVAFRSAGARGTPRTRFLFRQLPVLAIELPRLDTGQPGARPRHATVAARLRIEIDEPVLCADLVAVGVSFDWPTTSTILSAKPRASCRAGASSFLRRPTRGRAPPASGLPHSYASSCKRDVVPDAPLARRLEIFVRELLPRGCAREVGRCVEQPRLQLDEAGNAAISMRAS
jgi:hypothetical protein